MKICVLGAGTWGMALAALLSNNGMDTTVWSALPAEIDNLQKTGVHPNLPGVALPSQINYTKSLENACGGKDCVLFAVPSSFVRATAAAAAPFLRDDMIIIDAAKGMETGTLMTMTQIIDDEIKKLRPDAKPRLVALSGPTHAEEVARNIPTSIVSACEDEETARQAGDIFMNSCMRVYTNTDVPGVELCGALKNIIAIASGILRGMGYGDNTKAMLITRGIAEMIRIGLAMGCKRRTFSGLAGLGDLIVTCTSVHSRNNRCGELIGKGKTYEEASAEIGMVVEGYFALEAAMELSRRYGVEMPITSAVYDIIKNGRRPADVMAELMNRDMKSELDG